MELSNNPLALDDYPRYGRQMILDGFGLPGQLKLHQSSVVVVGAGGLGCPALQYLGASGIGRIGIIDHDRVELSNLQRQILHNEQTIGMYKADSAAIALKKNNSRLTVNTYTTAITSENALLLLGAYDIILDCTDNAPTRYLLSDSAVALGKPLVSGAAQKFDGQLCTYNLGATGPCYRCLFATPPPPESVGTCEETGILGVVTGVIGNLQALEAIKILTGLHDSKPSLLLFSALGSPTFRSIKLRSRKPNCSACGIDKKLGEIKDMDYNAFCGGSKVDWESRGLSLNNKEQRVFAKDLHEVLNSNAGPVNIIDVRSPTEFGICQLPSSINLPLKELLSLVSQPNARLPILLNADTYVICRLGNDSQIAAEALRKLAGVGTVKDVIGGLKAWSKQVDGNFPVY